MEILRPYISSPSAEERSLNGDFSGWSCNNGIIYSKAPARSCANKIPICSMTCVLACCICLFPF